MTMVGISIDETNRLCRAYIGWENDREYIAAVLAMMRVARSATHYPELARWTTTTRLSPMSGLSEWLDDPTVVDARATIKRHAAAAAENLQQFVAGDV